MTSGSRVLAVVRYDAIDQLRRPLAVLLPIALPIYVVTRSVAQTLATPRPVELAGGQHIIATMRELHGAGMAAIAVGFVSALLGSFVARSAQSADRRLAVVGFGSRELIASRLLVLLASATLVTLVAASVVAASVNVEHWAALTGSLWLTGMLFAAIGALLGTTLGVLPATYAALFAVLVDLGVAQNPMFNARPPDWAQLLPGYGSARGLYAAAFAPTFNAAGVLLLAAGWTAVALAAVVVAMRRNLPTTPSHPSTKATAHAQ